MTVAGISVDSKKAVPQGTAAIATCTNQKRTGDCVLLSKSLPRPPLRSPWRGTFVFQWLAEIFEKYPSQTSFLLLDSPQTSSALWLRESWWRSTCIATPACGQNMQVYLRDRARCKWKKANFPGLGMWAPTLHRSWQIRWDNSSYLEMSELGHTDLSYAVLESRGDTTCVLKCTTLIF